MNLRRPRRLRRYASAALLTPRPHNRTTDSIPEKSTAPPEVRWHHRLRLDLRHKGQYVPKLDTPPLLSFHHRPRDIDATATIPPPHSQRAITECPQVRIWRRYLPLRPAVRPACWSTSITTSHSRSAEGTSIDKYPVNARAPSEQQ